MQLWMSLSSLIEFYLYQKVRGFIMPRAGVDLEEFWKTAAASIPGKPMGRPEDMTEAVTWLCSDAASYFTGHAMVADEALTAGSLLE